MPPMVGSWEIEHLDNPTKWFALSRAYLEASLHLCQDMVPGRFTRNFPNAQVIMGLCHHSVELFYKGVLHSVTGQLPNDSHNLFDLDADLRKVAPDIADSFDCPFALETLPPGLNDGPIKKKLGNTRDQRFRYHLNKKGELWGGIEGFTPEYFLEVLRYCASQYEVIIHSISLIKGIKGAKSD